MGCVHCRRLKRPCGNSRPHRRPDKGQPPKDNARLRRKWRVATSGKYSPFLQGRATIPGLPMGLWGGVPEVPSLPSNAIPDAAPPDSQVTAFCQTSALRPPKGSGKPHPGRSGRVSIAPGPPVRRNMRFAGQPTLPSLIARWPEITLRPLKAPIAGRRRGSRPGNGTGLVNVTVAARMFSVWFFP